MLIKISSEGNEFVFDSNKDETILETLIRNDFDAPYSCQLGFCAICTSKLINGRIKTDDDSILTEKEKKLGMIVTCQSYPITDIEIKYD